MVFRQTQTVEERFWSKVDKSGDCWIWTGNVVKGYGQFWMPDRNWQAHIFSWESINGPVPEGMILRHKCDLGICVRPSHLEIGTNKDNTQDMLERGRARIRYPAKLIGRIREMRSKGASLREISLATGASETHVSRVCLGQGRTRI